VNYDNHGLTAPPLKRLFERLDFRRRDQKVLKAVLEQWKLAGRGRSRPHVRRKFPEASEAAERIFVHRVVEGERDYILVDGAKASATLLGPCEGKVVCARPKQASCRSSASPVR